MCKARTPRAIVKLRVVTSAMDYNAISLGRLSWNSRSPCHFIGRRQALSLPPDRVVTSLTECILVRSSNIAFSNNSPLAYVLYTSYHLLKSAFCNSFLPNAIYVLSSWKPPNLHPYHLKSAATYMFTLLFRLIRRQCRQCLSLHDILFYVSSI